MARKLKQDKTVEGQTPPDFLSQKLAEAESACRKRGTGRRAATLNKAEAEKIASDMQAVTWVVKFYRDKLRAAAARARCQSGIDRNDNRRLWLRELRASVDDFRRLTELTNHTYDSISDVPAWNPARALPCPYHWSDVLPIYERELSP